MRIRNPNTCSKRTLSDIVLKQLVKSNNCLNWRLVTCYDQQFKLINKRLTINMYYIYVCAYIYIYIYIWAAAYK